MVPDTGGKSSGSRAAHTAVSVIELQVPNTGHGAPEPYAPSIVVEAVVDQATGAAAIEEEGKGNGEIGGAGKVEITIVGKINVRIKVTGKLQCLIAGIGIVGGVAGADGGGCYIGRAGVGGIAIQFKVADESHGGGLGKKRKSEQAGGHQQGEQKE